MKTMTKLWWEKFTQCHVTFVIINLAQEDATHQDSTYENGQVQEERMKSFNSEQDEAIFEVCDRDACPAPQKNRMPVPPIRP